MSGTTTPTATLSVSNVAGSLGTTLLGVATMAPALAQSISTFTLPTTTAGWLQIGLGILALFAKG